MGMGEPLLNLDRVLAAVDALNDPRRFGLGAATSRFDIRRGAWHSPAHRARPQFTLRYPSTPPAIPCATCSSR